MCKELAEGNRCPGNDGSGLIDDRACDLRVITKGAAIMFDLYAKRATVAGLIHDASGAVFDVDGEIVSAVELVIGAGATDAVEVIPALAPTCRFYAEGCVPGIVWS